MKFARTFSEENDFICCNPTRCEIKVGFKLRLWKTRSILKRYYPADCFGCTEIWQTKPVRSPLLLIKCHVTNRRRLIDGRKIKIGKQHGPSFKRKAPSRFISYNVITHSQTLSSVPTRRQHHFFACVSASPPLHLLTALARRQVWTRLVSYSLAISHHAVAYSAWSLAGWF